LEIKTLVLDGENASGNFLHILARWVARGKGELRSTGRDLHR
jgi:hypothetical protein